MPAKPSTPSRVNSEPAPVLVEASCRRYCPGEVWTAVATTPLPAALTAFTTSARVPPPTSRSTTEPSDAVSVTGPPATTVPVEATTSAETRVCAAATAVTSKVILPVAVPVAVAATDDDVDVTAEAAHVDVRARLVASVPTPLSAVESLPRASAACCCLACCCLTRVCWLVCRATSWLMIEDVSRPDTAPEIVRFDIGGLLVVVLVRQVCGAGPYAWVEQVCRAAAPRRLGRVAAHAAARSCHGRAITAAASAPTAGPGWPAPAWRCRPATGSGSW